MRNNREEMQNSKGKRRRETLLPTQLEQQRKGSNEREAKSEERQTELLKMQSIKNPRNGGSKLQLQT